MFAGGTSVLDGLWLKPHFLNSTLRNEKPHFCQNADEDEHADPAHAHYQEDRWRKVTNRAKKAAEKDHQESRAYQQLGSKADANGLE